MYCNGCSELLITERLFFVKRLVSHFNDFVIHVVNETTSTTLKKINLQCSKFFYFSSP